MDELLGVDPEDGQKIQVCVDRALLDEAGFLPHLDLRITVAAWEDCVAWTDEDTERVGVPQDDDGRLWDVVWMARMAYRRGIWTGDRMDVWLHRWPSAASTQPPAEATPRPAEDEDPEPPLVRLVGRLERTTTRTRIVLDLPTGEDR